ncbi:hypothetical protein BC962_1242 [Gillisia mitskevichiae]|uniref:SpoIIAA-like protein n=1 Tax=Gillisia mitskevichiae TaxID=270921 RepID=A0A495PS18_9FLAO|nr:hypothetical protein [Gillisia mitskevichiae]RKS52997.1 hypothetical protein BC962_1242 [Gillisia mitskevichiae]
MVEKITEFYKMEFYNSYVIIEGLGQQEIDSSISKRTIETILDHYKGNNFVIISNRTTNYTLMPDAYSPGVFKKIKGIAIVSKYEEVREKAIIEQEKFDSSFAFFSNLEDAKHWAENFFATY